MIRKVKHIKLVVFYNKLYLLISELVGLQISFVYFDDSLVIVLLQNDRIVTFFASFFAESFLQPSHVLLLQHVAA